MIQINAVGEPCPIPVVKTMKAMEELKEQETIEVLVDNEIAVENLKKMATNKGYKVDSHKVNDNLFKVVLTSGEISEKPMESDKTFSAATVENTNAPKKKVVVISSNKMGDGNEDLGKVLIKGFIYALSEQKPLPESILFYNSGAELTSEGSNSLEDLRLMKDKGVEILTCGTCLDFYGLKDKLAVGEVTNMYTIVERLSEADLIIRP